MATVSMPRILFITSAVLPDSKNVKNWIISANSK
jgi:hypothetical protein